MFSNNELKATLNIFLKGFWIVIEMLWKNEISLKYVFENIWIKKEICYYIVATI
jgi:hypothetical protein